MFPDELRGLTPVEEKLIALNSSYPYRDFTAAAMTQYLLR
jgi:hypothetical protein